MKKILLVIVVMMLLAAGIVNAGILGSKHDLSGKGYGTTELCIFCHTPHNANLTGIPVVLWNHDATSANYTPYSSASLNATVGQPGGVSKACLSCHDGTIAVDSYYTQPGNTLHTGTHFITNTANLGTNLSNDHPVGFTYNAALVTADGELATPAGGKVDGKYPLYGAGSDQMECPTCHKVHDPTNVPFLRASNAASAMCLGCHTK